MQVKGKVLHQSRAFIYLNVLNDLKYFKLFYYNRIKVNVWF